MSKTVCKCHGLEPSGGSGFFYVTPTLLPRIKGNPLNLPQATFICSITHKPCEIEEKKECELCGHLIKEIKEFNGKELCEQCYIGEAENPEHQI